MKRRHKMRTLRFLRRYSDIAEELQKLGTQLNDANNLFMVGPAVARAVIILTTPWSPDAVRR